MMTNENAVVIDADGFFGDTTIVYFSGSVQQCQAFAKRGNCQVLVGCHKKKGDKLTRGGIDACVSRGDWSRLAA